MLPKYGEMLDRLIKNLPEVTFNDVRFEIPRAQTMIQGNRTIVQNFSEITGMMGREPKHLLKYLNKELATVGNVEKHRIIFQGKFLSAVINKRIASYAKEYVYCPECGKPDTKLVREGRVHLIKCMACGARRPVRSF